MWRWLLNFPTITDLIQTYFPEGQWGYALCIVEHECPPSTNGYPGACVRRVPRPIIPAGLWGCAWGPFGLVDTQWNPDFNPGSPFTLEQWAWVLDPNVNTWMASKVWSQYGWGMFPACPSCMVASTCRAPGGEVPYPDGPLPELSLPRLGIPAYAVPVFALGIGVGALAISLRTLLGRR